MNSAAPLQTSTAKPLQSAGANLVLQRKCACGGGASGLTGECEDCGKKKLVRLQTKLRINEPGDAYEQEADRVAEQVLARPAHPDLRRTPPRIQRYAGRSNGQVGEVPTSVDRVLASPGRPLEPALRKDMEQRFGHDFSRVRVHAGAATEQSARDVNAHAYTVGHSIVFGANRFTPRTHEGRRLIAHELTHVVQQSGANGSQVVQRDVDQQKREGAHEGPSLFTMFVANPRKRTDKRFAREQGKVDAAAIRQNDALSVDQRQLVNAKLSFFEGAAKEAYTQEVKPALVVATRRQIEMPLMYTGKLPDVPPAEQERIRRRRERTYRAFSKYQDYQLKDAYTSRLQRYLDEGMEANDYWDAEMIEQIIAERAPNAPWHAAARQEFLAKRAIQERSQARERSLPMLPPYWQNQFGALAKQTAGWPEDLQTYARNLLWKWREQVAPFDKNVYLRDVVQPAVAEDLIFNDIVEQFEVVLRDRDRAIQSECRQHPPGRLMKVWGDPCKPWFGDDGLRGEDELRFLRILMRNFRDKDRVPYRDIVYFLQEFVKRLDAQPTSMAGAHLQILQTWSTVQGSIALGVQPGKNVAALSSAATSTELAVGKVQRALGVATEIEGVEAVGRAPASTRTVPPAPHVAPIEVEAPPRPATSAPKPLAPPPVASAAAERPPAPPTNRPSTTVPRQPSRVGRLLQKLYLSVGMTVDELIPEHRDIAGGSVGKRPTPALIEKAPSTAAGREIAPRPAPRADAPVGSVAEAPALPAPVEAPTPTVAEAPAANAAPAPNVGSPAAPAPASPSPAAQTAGTPATVAPTAAAPSAAPSPTTQVYINTRSGVYHLPGSRWYGRTAQGGYMTLAAALAAGYHQAGSARTPPPSGVYSVERHGDGVEIRAWIGPREARAGLEREMHSAAEYAIAVLAGWQRAHSTGPGLGIESGEAIRLAPEFVNQIFQNRGIEGFLRALRDLAGTEDQLHLQTITETHPNTLRLKSIHYVVGRAEGDRIITAFEAVIEVEDGRARAGVRLSGNKYTFGPWFAQ